MTHVPHIRIALRCGAKTRAARVGRQGESRDSTRYVCLLCCLFHSILPYNRGNISASVFMACLLNTHDLDVALLYGHGQFIFCKPHSFCPDVHAVCGPAPTAPGVCVTGTLLRTGRPGGWRSSRGRWIGTSMPPGTCAGWPAHGWEATPVPTTWLDPRPRGCGRPGCSSGWGWRS